MRAIVVSPGVAHSVRLADVPEPAPEEGSVLVDTLALGVCGTDREIIAGLYGEAPAGAPHLVLGHESLGRVRDAPEGSGLAPGDLVVGIVRRPDPEPCPACAAGEWDMCRNGRYTERGIKARHGFGAERFRIEPEFAIRVAPDLGLAAVLMEPTSIVAKAWDHIGRVAARARSAAPQRVLVTGAGPIGLLAAMISVQRGHDTHVFDRSPEGPKPKLTAGIGATYHVGDAREVIERLRPDVIVECTGAVPVIAAALGQTAPAGMVCLLGVGASATPRAIDLGGLNRTLVLDNQVIFGAVNANHMHYEMAAEALAAADRGWLEQLINRRVPLDRMEEAFDNRPDDIKVVVTF